VLGTAATVLGSGSPDLADDRNSVDVQLVDPGQWITSCDDGALAGGANLAILGSELFQFGNASALGGGRFRLTRLLRGRAGTEWACDGHLAGETFCLIDSRSLQSVALPSWSVGALVDAEARGARASITFVGESVRPPSPVNLSAAAQPNGDLVLSWFRRSRTGFAWVDEIDAPLGESREEYRVDISGASGSVSLTCDEPTVTVSAADLASLGSGAAQIEVRQIGDLAASRPALLSITLV
jgi:hypothetical protein